MRKCVGHTHNWASDEKKLASQKLLGFFLSWTELWKTLWCIYSPICWHIHINWKSKRKKAKLWLAVLVAITLIYLRVQTRPNLTWPRATSGPNSVSLHINKPTIRQCWSTVHTSIQKHEPKETFRVRRWLLSAFGCPWLSPGVEWGQGKALPVTLLTVIKGNSDVSITHPAQWASQTRFQHHTYKSCGVSSLNLESG